MTATAPSHPSILSFRWLAAALGVMPFLQYLPIDFDRSVPLFLLAPFVWFGRSLLGSAFGRLSLAPWWMKNSLVLFVATTVAAVLFANRFAPAATTAATWVLLAIAGLMAGELITRDRATGPHLLGAVAAGTAAGTLAVWLLWWWGGRGAVPLYAHHRIFGLHTLGGAVAATALLVHSWNQPGRRFAWAIIGAIVWGGLLWSGGRGPALALFLALVAWWLLGDSGLRRQLACAGGLLLASGLLLSLAQWSPRPELGWWNALHRSTTSEAGAPALSLSTITSTRSEFWRESLQRAQLRPWLGHGPDAYRFLTPKLDGQQPHNLVLQLLLDVGVVGTAAALFWLVGVMVAGTRRVWTDRGRGVVAPWFAMALASLMAGLLDGVFYHVVAFLPAVIALGTASVAVTSRPAAPVARGWIVTGHSLLIGALAVLALHTWVFYSLAVALPPAGPAAWRARLVRAFPSTTFGLWRWLDAWQGPEPAATLAWSRWAQEHSANPPAFHVYAAQLLLNQGDRAGAAKELRAAATKAHWSGRPALAETLRALETPGH